MIVSAHQPHYLPWLGYLHKIAVSDAFVFLDQVQYKHREFQNRNKIRTKTGWFWLTVPVQVKGKRTQLISEVLIDNQFNWQADHWKGLCVNYSHAPYFKQYEQVLRDCYSRPWQRLCELNVHIIRFLLQEFAINTPLYFESQLGIGGKRSERLAAIAKCLKASVYLSGIGAKVYLTEEVFERAGITVQYQSFVHPSYRQQCAQGTRDFFPYLCALDLLFNEGPQHARQLLLNGGSA